MTLVPGAGDDVQALKAGIMEIADIFVVNKADREGADRLVSSIEATLSLQSYEAGEWRPPILKTVATSGVGMTRIRCRASTCSVEHAVDKRRLGHVARSCSPSGAGRRSDARFRDLLARQFVAARRERKLLAVENVQMRSWTASPRAGTGSLYGSR